jgi:S-adenosylmethionine/arginine decarboxylase-like enzyme
MTTNLGEKEWQVGFRIVPRPSKWGLLENPQSLLRLAWGLIEFIGMTKDGNPDVRFYPANGKGGTGIQLYQPLVESWLVVGTWPEHGIIRVNLSSCKPYDHEAVKQWLEEQIGTILKQTEGIL